MLLFTFKVNCQFFSSPWNLADPNREKDYVEIIKRPNKACVSNVGQMSQGKQIWSLNRQCLDYPEIMHHLFHIFGFAHENNRADHDNYIESQ